MPAERHRLAAPEVRGETVTILMVKGFIDRDSAGEITGAPCCARCWANCDGRLLWLVLPRID
jgi:hypothetical protein